VTRGKGVRPFGEHVGDLAAPVSGSASAATSATVRFAHPVSVCQDGLAS
jgi:hypothetical protein